MFEERRYADGSSHGSGTTSRSPHPTKTGTVIDDSFRVAAFRQAAAKRGYARSNQIEKLLDDYAHDVRRNLKGPDSHAVRTVNSAVVATRVMASHCSKLASFR